METDLENDPAVVEARNNSKYLSGQIVHFTNGSNELDFSCPRMLAIMEPHLKAPRQQRKSILKRYDGLIDKMMERLGDLQYEKNFKFDCEQYPVRAAFCNTLFSSSDIHLPELHLNYNCDKGLRGDRHQKMELLKPLLNAERRAIFQSQYEKLVIDVILEDSFRGCGETVIYYQAMPYIRVIRPNEFSVKIHADLNYGFNPANVNYYLPLTAIHGSNGLHVESAPGKEDWHSLHYDYGDIYRFNGGICMHFTTENCSGHTRVSLDFRVIPQSCYRLVDDRLSRKPGYYVRAERDASGKWTRMEELLEPDERNGFPFTDI